ncbi:hypothetical protein X797_005618 [Metarhizium robertsii]|uniref:Uncharacterized protein n=2 Tax=Metarhizium TaxID=5529 RepID=A0A0D9NQR6_METAN|nr:hypothetical protein X797_005618 [Metarhizium robertsii]KJK76236.1 hypothetical protein H634G_08642 [Metarhizium anisopliae BRIP 53293]KJK84750.1 hypothetical protein H633G_11476 [Metarhizium anisopliae BRIP 53284]
MLFPSTFIPAALLFFGAAVVSARPAADVAAESSADDKTYAISAILRYRQKEKKDVEDVVVRVAE